MQLLVEKGADVNAQGGPYEDALQTELAVETRNSGLPRAETYIISRKRPDINDPLILCSISKKKIVGVSQPKKILRLMGSGDGSAGVENKWRLFFLRAAACRIQTSLFSEFLPLYRHMCSGSVWCWLCHDLRDKTSLLTIRCTTTTLDFASQRRHPKYYN